MYFNSKIIQKYRSGELPIYLLRCSQILPTFYISQFKTATNDNPKF